MENWSYLIEPRQISISRRTRRTPFSRRVEACGVKAYTVYNHMLLPTVFASIEEDYSHLKKNVQLWDVAVERQVEIKGPDAKALMQYLTPRDLTNFQIGQCLYVPIVDDQGGMLNDPLANKLDEDHYYISIADSDLLLWVKGIALAKGMNVKVQEPSVHPLAIQGPKSKELISRVFDQSVLDLKFFRFVRAKFQGHEWIISRSGYSKQSGYEIYVEGDEEEAEALWDALMEAGEDLEVRAGCPNLIERIEAGLLSYGNDITVENNPYQCGLGKFCQPHKVDDCIGREALINIEEQGPDKIMRSFNVGGPPLFHRGYAWDIIVNDRVVGQVTSCAYSPDFGHNVALGMIDVDFANDGTEVIVKTYVEERESIVKEKSFI